MMEMVSIACDMQMGGGLMSNIRYSLQEVSEDKGAGDLLSPTPFALFIARTGPQHK